MSTQVVSSLDEAMLPAMWGRATLTTVVSTISMKVPAITAMVISHLFTETWLVGVAMLVSSFELLCGDPRGRPGLRSPAGGRRL